MSAVSQPIAVEGRSRFLPRFLDAWLGIGGLAYLVLSLSAEIWPKYQDKVFIYSQPAFFGEIALTLWLLTKGARQAQAEI